jgi:hypothetical protein
MVDNYTAPIFLTDEAKALNDRFYLLLNEVVTAFPDGKFNPTKFSVQDRTKTNKYMYDLAMANMLQIQNEYFLYKNDVVKSSEGVLTYIKEIDAIISIMDEENGGLIKTLKELKSSSHSAEGLFDDTQISRNELLYGNIFLFIIIVVGGFSVYKKLGGNPLTPA